MMHALAAVREGQDDRPTYRCVQRRAASRAEGRKARNGRTPHGVRRARRSWSARPPCGGAAAYLGERLSADYVVMARYAPRDVSSDVVPLVVLGPHGVLVVALRDEEGALVCYQDH